MDQSKLLELQVQMRQNNADLQSYLTGLDSWADDIKVQDDKLKTCKDGEAQSKLPPVRNSLVKKKKKKRKTDKKEEIQPKKSTRIRGFDFRAWDKYDVDKAVAEIDQVSDKHSSSSEYETDEEWEMERRIQQANDYKDQGNISFKEGKYDNAIEFYTRGIDCDPTNAILPANRAMALLKQEKYAAAEVDCTSSLVIDPTYVKAYSRRATARLGLKFFQDARRDFEKVLSLEPNNKFAKAEIQKLEEKLKPIDKVTKAEVSETTGTVQAIYKPPGKRSKKPLRRIQIEEIGADDGQGIREAIAKVEATQSEAKRRVTDQDSKMFDKFVPAETRAATNSELENGERGEKINGNIENSSGAGDVASSNEEPPSFSSPDDINSVRESLSTKPEATSGNYEVTSSETPLTQSGSPRIPDVPTSSFQFQADWKILKNHPDKFYQYFKRIEPTQYAKLLGQALDADILNAMFLVLRDFYLPSESDIYPVLQNFTTVKRFSMTIMFMSAKEKQILHSLFDYMKTMGRHDSTEIEKLSKKYEL